MQAYIAVEDIERFKDGIFYVFFSGCNFRCPYCNAKELVDFREENIAFLKDLKREMKEQNVKKIFFTGGEPTLQRQALLNLSRFAKNEGIETILDTNGSKPNTLKSLLREKLMDEIHLDLKVPLEKEKFDRITRSATFFKPTEGIMDDIEESINLLEESEVKLKVTTIIIPSLMYRKEDILSIAGYVNRLGCEWELLPFNPEKTLNRTLQNISRPSDKFINNMKETCLEKYPQLRFTGED
ncbi:MAG: radical SAM protein [Nanobdellota archaeon]